MNLHRRVLESKMVPFVLTVIYSFLLSLIFKRPPSFSLAPTFSYLGLLAEIISFLLTAFFVWRFYKKYGFSNAFSFFVPLFLVGAVVEGDWILSRRFAFHQLNFYFWDTPVAIILYYSGGYCLYNLYQKFGPGLLNKLKVLAIHLLVDSTVTTPLAILFGFWSFKSTLLDGYPYIVPIVHLGEVSLGLFYVIFQEWLIKRAKVDKKLKPVISLSVIFLLLVFYSFTGHYFDKLI